MSLSALPSGHPDALWILDLSSWTRAAWGQLKPDPDDIDDRSVVRLFASRLASLFEWRQPARLIAAADSTDPPWQKELWAGYKADRPTPGPSYFEQLRVIRQLLRLHNVPVLESPGFQADDVMATVTRRARAAGQLVVLITKDHDLWQLVGPGVQAWGGGKEDPAIDVPAVVKRYHGIGPDRLADLMALAGDDDEAPGIDGIGDKIAARLLLTHGSLDEVLRKWQWEKGKLSEKIRLGADSARLSRELVGLRDAPVWEKFHLDDAIVQWSMADALAIRDLGVELESEDLLRMRPAPMAPHPEAHWMDEALEETG